MKRKEEEKAKRDQEEKVALEAMKLEDRYKVQITLAIIKVFLC